MPKTEIEEKGFISNETLRDINGRSRKAQILMTEEFNISNYPCAGGGCLLTDKQFGSKLRDLFPTQRKELLLER